MAVDGGLIGLPSPAGAAPDNSLNGKLVLLTSFCIAEPAILFRMRGIDTTLSRSVYWTTITIDSLAAEYTGPGPVTGVVASHVIDNGLSCTLLVRMRAFDTTLGRLVYWTTSVIDSGAAEYTGPGPVTGVVVSHVIGTGSGG